jgi:DNA-binding NtrC family response regulator
MSWQPGKTLDQVEKEAIQLAMNFFQNNKTHTARALGISFTTLGKKLDRYKDDEQKRQKEQNHGR